MKANELRIGNLVEYHIEDELDERKEWWEVITIDSEDINWLEKEDPESIDYKPIPLTEEWLLKFGAKRLNPKRGILKEFVLKTVRIEMSNSGNFYYKNSKLVLESIQQLQNLYFALTGTELEIKK